MADQMRAEVVPVTIDDMTATRVPGAFTLVAKKYGPALSLGTGVVGDRLVILLPRGARPRSIREVI